MSLLKRIVQFWKTLVTLIVIMTLCLIPSSEIQKIDLFKFNYEDLLVHLIMFTFFSSVLFHDLQRSSLQMHSNAVTSAWVLTSGILLGILTEMLQYVLVSLNRSASITDFIFDLAGTALGIAYMRFIRR
jgi:VanZ family protein